MCIPNIKFFISEQQSLYLVQNFHIYLLRSGRINMCGINPGNVEYVAKAIYAATTELPAPKL